MTETVSHKRIAKNTVMLFLRGLIGIIIGLFTSRIVIDILGVDNYGVYGVAGGFVGMLGFINASMASASMRFITYEMGLGDQERIKKTFANSLMVHIIIAVFIIVICELVGVWFLNHKLNIPPDRMYAANWVFQLSILTAAVSFTQVPYTALVISHEKMGIYAYMEIINVILKLLIVYMLVVLPGDKLIVYATLTAFVGILIAMLYRFYCLKHFPESHTGPKYDKGVLKPILSFSGWNLFWSMCSTLRTQGTTFIINIFFGVAINGASAISSVINGTISGFSFNIITASRPQIVKSYAQKAYFEFQRLIEFSSLLAAMLLSTMAIPLIIETQYVFSLWLGEVPAYVVIFSRITIVTAIITQINSVIANAIEATGNIKKSSFITGTFLLFSLPLMYFMFKKWHFPQLAYYLLQVFYFILFLINVVILRQYVKEFKIKRFLCTIGRLPLFWILPFFSCYFLHIYLKEGFLRFFFVCFTSVIINILITYLFVLDKNQKKNVLPFIQKKWKALFT